MINSMTGYGRSETMHENIKLIVEVRSVNHRYHEIMFKMPKDLLPLEDQMKKMIQSYVKRGRIDVFITVDMEENPYQQIKVDWNLANQYIEVANNFKEKFGFNGQMEMKDILAIPDIIHVGQEILNIDVIENPLLETLKRACQNLVQMRADEGKNLYQDLEGRIQTMKDTLLKMKERAPLVIEDYRTKLMGRISEWMNGVAELDESRLLNEVAFFTDKANVDEEMTRLQSHFQQFMAIMNQEEPVGRKLDFLIQEMNREVNTIGSKANDIVLSQFVVEMKSELEKTREQVQNVE